MASKSRRYTSLFCPLCLVWQEGGPCNKCATRVMNRSSTVRNISGCANSTLISSEFLDVDFKCKPKHRSCWEKHYHLNVHWQALCNRCSSVISSKFMFWQVPFYLVGRAYSIVFLFNPLWISSTRDRYQAGVIGSFVGQKWSSKDNINKF